MAKINLDISSLLRDWQKEFFEGAKKYNVLVLHRRAWKTVVAILFLIYKALKSKGDYWYVAPFRNQAETIAWDYLKKFWEQIPSTKTNNSKLILTFPNGSKITVFGADNPDALRGLDLKGVVLDEYAQMNRIFYEEIIFPMINAHKDWWATWIGTPKGKNIFYDLYQKAVDSDKYYTMYLNVYETGLLDEAQIEDAKQEQSQDAFAQEYMLDWDVSIKGSFYWKQLLKAFEDNRVLPNLYDPTLPVYTAWDLWVNDKTVILFFQYYQNRIRIIDEVEGSNEWLPYYHQILRSRPYAYKMHFVPHDVAVKEFSTWMTRYETFQKMFWWDKVQKLTRQNVQDWINMVRTILDRTVWDSSLEEYMNILWEYRPKFNEKTGEFGKPIHCDHSDAMRYLATAYNYFVDVHENYETFSVDYSNLL